MSPRSNAPDSSPEKDDGAPAPGTRTERPPAAPPVPPEPGSAAPPADPSDLSGRLRALLRRTGGPRSRRVGGVVLVLALVITGLGWIFASPVGGSPDDDYHLGSIWCPRPLESSGCRTRVSEDGVLQVLVPETVADNTPCYAFHPRSSAACRFYLSDDVMEFTSRYDDGNYPYGYYQFHHLLVSPSVTRSVLLMRAVNLAIAIALLGGIAAAMPTTMRRGYALAIMVSWIPMGVYFITSNNPSSWALTGVLAYAAGLYGSVHHPAPGARRWVLLALAAVGALLCCTSRGDSAFFVFVVSLAVLITAPWRRAIAPQALTALVASAIGVRVMTTTGQARAVHEKPAFPGLSLGDRLKLDITTLPDYFAGFYGRRWGAGWFDVPFDGAVAIVSVSLAGAALFLGARRLTRRKALAALVVFGAMSGIPIVAAVQNFWPYVYQYQPRYMLPLLAVFFLLWFVVADGPPFASRPQIALLLGLSAAVHSLALHIVIQRYTRGMDDQSFSMLSNLNSIVRWWWNVPVSPMTVWQVASTTYLIAVVTAVALTRPRDGARTRSECADDAVAP